MASKNLYWFKLKNTYFNQLVTQEPPLPGIMERK